MTIEEYDLATSHRPMFACIFIWTSPIWPQILNVMFIYTPSFPVQLKYSLSMFTCTSFHQSGWIQSNFRFWQFCFCSFTCLLHIFQTKCMHSALYSCQSCLDCLYKKVYAKRAFLAHSVSIADLFMKHICKTSNAGLQTATIFSAGATKFSEQSQMLSNVSLEP